MFTRDSKILSRRLTTPLTSVANAVGDVFKPITFSYLIKSLFANNEQGFAYDPNDLTTMFQDAAGTVPVTGVGRTVGLMLDKSKGLVRSVELLADTSFDNPAYWTVGSGWVISGGLATATNASSGIQAAYLLTVGKWYEASITITCTAGELNLPYDGLGLNITSVSVTGTYKRLFRATRQTFYACFGSDFSGTIDNISLKEILGNHTFQTTSSMRPLLVASPQRLDYDTADDKLITTLPAQLTGCTVVRAVPNVGTQILTNQTIPTPYNDNTDNCGLIVINRALTTTETSQITKLFDKAAGV